VSQEKIGDFADHGIATDVAVGLETATDRVRHDCVNKYFDFSDFEDAARGGGRGRRHLRRRRGDQGVPPDDAALPRGPEAAADMIDSIRRCGDVDGCHTVSMNPTNVQRYTMVDDAVVLQGRLPPAVALVWSVAHVLKETADVDIIVVSDPVGHGSDRGAHNCGECDDRDDRVQTAIKDFDKRQDPSVFEQVSCECEATWGADE